MDDFKCPQCGEGRQREPDHSCTCRELLMISIPPGEHIHINCPVHGDRKVYGPPATRMVRLPPDGAPGRLELTVPVPVTALVSKGA